MLTSTQPTVWLGELFGLSCPVFGLLADRIGMRPVLAGGLTRPPRRPRVRRGKRDRPLDPGGQDGGYVIVTDGEAGIDGVSPADAAMVRQKEQLASAAIAELIGAAQGSPRRPRRPQSRPIIGSTPPSRAAAARSRP